MHELPLPPWLEQSAAAEGLPSQLDVPAMPHAGVEQRAVAAADRSGPQPEPEISGLHDVPRVHPRVQFQRSLLQTLRRGASMRPVYSSELPRAAGKVPVSAQRQLLTVLSLLMTVGMLSFAAWAQNPSTTNSSGVSANDTSSEGEGKEYEGYKIQQTVEVGYRFNEINGNPNMYQTLVNYSE